MSLITITNLTFAYDGTYDNIFSDLSLTLDSNMRVGFVARNGKGKTTLMRLLSGELDSGSSISASVEFEYFPYAIQNSDHTVLDIIAEISGLSADMDEWLVARELNKLDMRNETLTRPFNTLSGGERAKVQLAALFLKPSRFLLIDEPTNHLDADGRHILGEYLRKKSGFLLASHDRLLLDACTTHTLSITNSKVTLQRGGFSVWEQNKQNQDKLEAEQNERLSKDIRRLNSAKTRTAAWADKLESTKIGQGPCDRGYIGAKSADMMRHAKAVETRLQRSVEEKSKLLKDIDRTPALKLHPLKHYSARLAELSNMNLFYGGVRIFSDISLRINQGERISISGKNGCGKTSLLRLILGETELMRHDGDIYRAPDLIISYAPQDTSGLCGSLYGYADECNIDISLFLTILRKLDFSRTQFDKDMSQFSAGQQKKVSIARSLCQKAHLYIWDEPLNYIDVISRIQIEKLIETFQPTLVFVEHDRAFTNKLATRTIELTSETSF